MLARPNVPCLCCLCQVLHMHLLCRAPEHSLLLQLLQAWLRLLLPCLLLHQNDRC
jgi:hypothetical protein